MEHLTVNFGQCWETACLTLRRCYHGWTDLPPPPPWIDYLWVGLVESGWAELRASALPAVSLIIHRGRGGLWHTHTLPPTYSLCLSDTHTHTFLSPLLSAHTTTCAPIWLTSSIQHKQMGHPCIHAQVCLSQSSVCTSWHSHGDKLHSRT